MSYLTTMLSKESETSYHRLLTQHLESHFMVPFGQHTQCEWDTQCV